MPEVRGVVLFSDRSPAAGHRVSGAASGMLGGMVGPTSTDSRGRFTLAWNSSATGLAKLMVDGTTRRTDVRAGEDVGEIQI